MTPLVMKLAIMETEVYHEFPIENMPDASQANDSGYESFESASQATEDSFEFTLQVDVEDTDKDNVDQDLNDRSDIMSTYSIGAPTPQYAAVYIEEFCRRLIEDMRQQLESENALGPDLVAYLPNLLQRFGRRIHSEAKNQVEREAAVFIRKHRG